jgi:hypothetical protein
MIHALLRPIIGLMVVMLLPILAIHAQPYDDGGLRDFLTAEDCAAPCFLDIHPGTTALYKADLMLNANDWVSEVDRNMHTLLGEPATIRWQWNGRQPWFFADDGWNSAHSENGIMVDEMLVETRLTLGDLWLSLGPPEAYETTIFDSPRGVFLGIILHYPDLTIPATIHCPYHKSLWQTPGIARFQSEPSLTQPAINSQPLGRQVVELDEEFCAK